MKGLVVVLGYLVLFTGCSENEAKSLEEMASVEMKENTGQEGPSDDPVKESIVKKATYRLTFTSLWEKDDHLGRPEGAHFSPIVLTVHNENHVLFPIGELTGKGLERVAEVGNPTDLNVEIAEDKRRGNVLSSLNTKNQDVPKQLVQTIDVEVNFGFPLISFVTMIAPSPDWIVGLDSLELHDGEKFLESTGEIDLYAYNAGTEDGDRGGNFSINNSATRNPTPIEKLKGRGFDKPFAKVVLQKIK
ncbi:MAG: spondin domain-containing protein [Bdellovibrionales bacterium]